MGWEDTPSAELVYQDMKQANGEEWKYADRRQELVFIGQGLKHDAIQKILDKCLLNDEEMEMWAEAFADVDKIQLTLDDGGDEEEGEEEEEGEDDGEEDEEKAEMSEGSEMVPAKKKKGNK